MNNKLEELINLYQHSNKSKWQYNNTNLIIFDDKHEGNYTLSICVYEIDGNDKDIEYGTDIEIKSHWNSRDWVCLNIFGKDRHRLGKNQNIFGFSLTLHYLWLTPKVLTIENVK